MFLICMSVYKTHRTRELSAKLTGEKIKIAGWVHNKRDHGGVLFVEIRDFDGIIQVVFDQSKNAQIEQEFSKISLESVVSIEGVILKRDVQTINQNIKNGDIEIECHKFELISKADPLPFVINEEKMIHDDIRMRYRFLDLRRPETRNKIILRSKVISFLRKKMESIGFTEFQTPILTASSPEGARDFLVPSSKKKGKFYALPQAPQQFKQILMASGIEKYFQIAPCFRDEDQRADRSPGEFYQLDIEMSFATRQDVFNVVNEVISETFTKFGNKKLNPHVPIISYDESMLMYGSDKPDLRIPTKNFDATEIFKNSGFSVFDNIITSGGVVRGIVVPKGGSNPRSFFDNMITFAQQNGAKGLAWIKINSDGTLEGVPAKFLDDKRQSLLMKHLENGDAVFFSSGTSSHANQIAGIVRKEIGKIMNLVADEFNFCWIVDFPYFEYDDKTKKIDFCHNPFSMPYCDINELNNMNKTELLSLKANQYDLVCNGIELSSGAVRNYNIELFLKAFEIAGYQKQEVIRNFPGILSAFRYGVPPHAGIAPGIERMIMLLTNSENIRDVILFPMTSSGEDLLMNAPSEIDSTKLMKELGIKVYATESN